MARTSQGGYVEVAPGIRPAAELERAARRRAVRDEWMRTTGKLREIPPAMAFEPAGGPARRNGR